MKKAKTIGFCGEYTQDVMLYLALILTELKKQVCIADYSFENSFQYFIPGFGEEEGVTYRNVEYRLRPAGIETYEDEFDFLLVNNAGTTGFACDEYYIMTDCTKSALIKSEEEAADLKGPISFVIRNCCDCKINAAFVKQQIRKFQCRIQNIYSLPLDSIDYEYYLLLQYEQCQEFRELSVPFKKFLISCISDYTHVNKKEIETAYKKAGKGRKVCR